MFEGKENRRYVGLFFRNSAAMTPVLKFNNDSTSTLSFITIGGDIDLYVFIKGTAREVVEAYQSMIRPAYLPPFWALGWQEVPPNGFTQQNILDAVKGYKDKFLPLDSVYLPASSWDNEKDFTLNASQISDIKALKQSLSQQGKKLVAYVDAAVSVQNRNSNPAYTGCPQCFIKSGQYKD
jgi:alpha-glucosidase